MPDIDPFEPLFEANSQTPPPPRMIGHGTRHLAVVTCMDVRIDPLSILGLTLGEANVIRNAGARVTDDVLRSLVFASQLLGVRSVLLMAHTQCGVIGSDAAIRSALARAANLSVLDDAVGSFEPMAIADSTSALASDAALINSHPLLAQLAVAAAVFDVVTGRITRYQLPSNS